MLFEAICVIEELLYFIFLLITFLPKRILCLGCLSAIVAKRFFLEKRDKILNDSFDCLLHQFVGLNAISLCFLNYLFIVVLLRSLFAQFTLLLVLNVDGVKLVSVVGFFGCPEGEILLFLCRVYWELLFVL